MDSDPADKVQATFGSRVLSGCQNLVASFTEETNTGNIEAKLGTRRQNWSLGNIHLPIGRRVRGGPVERVGELNGLDQWMNGTSISGFLPFFFLLREAQEAFQGPYMESCRRGVGATVTSVSVSVDIRMHH